MVGSPRCPDFCSLMGDFSTGSHHGAVARARGNIVGHPDDDGRRPARSSRRHRIGGADRSSIHCIQSRLLPEETLYGRPVPANQGRLARTLTEPRTIRRTPRLDRSGLDRQQSRCRPRQPIGPRHPTTSPSCGSHSATGTTPGASFADVSRTPITVTIAPATLRTARK
jgi:hypothetical protein